LAFSTDGSFTYTPNTHYVGPDSFTYTWSDGLDVGNTATVSIDVYNSAPYAYDASFSVVHDHQLTGQLSGDDADGDVITARLQSDAQFGRLNLEPDGTFIYTPDPGFTGTDSFRYYWTDPLGLASGVATAVIFVMNNAPQANNDEYYVLAGSAVKGDLLANDMDPDGDPLRVVKINDQPVRQLMQLPSGAQLVMSPNGQFIYVPAASQQGQDCFTYTITDSVESATATVSVWTVGIRGVEWVTFSGGHTVYSDPTRHEPPQVPNYTNWELRRSDWRLEPGIVVAIEPMVNMGHKEVVTLPDKWTIVTRNRLPSAHVEHTVAITDHGIEVLTRD